MLWIVLPYSSDALFYHRPWLTRSIVVASCTLSLAAFFDTIPRSVVEWLSLTLGFHDVVRPWEWFTSALIHDHVLTLICAAPFFWVFGSMVEGRLGWWRTLLVYAGILAADGLVMQWLAEDFAPFSVRSGLTGLTWGTLAIACVWNARTEVSLVRAAQAWWENASGFEQAAPPKLVLTYLILEAFSSVLCILGTSLEIMGKFPVLPHFAHLAMFPLGLTIGVQFFDRGWVRHDGLDWFSRKDYASRAFRRERTFRAHDDPKSAEELERFAELDPDSPLAARLEAEADMRRSLEVGRVRVAFERFVEAIEIDAEWRLSEDLLLRLLQDLEGHDLFEEMLRVLPENRAHLSKHDSELRLFESHALVGLRRPASALDVIERMLPDHAMTESEIAARDRVRSRAEELHEDGVLELDVTDP